MNKKEQDIDQEAELAFNKWVATMKSKWTPKEQRTQLKHVTATRRDLCKVAKTYHPWDYDYIIQMLDIMLHNMYEYYLNGVNVWQADESRAEVVQTLNQALDYLDDYKNGKWVDEYKALKKFFEYVGEHIMKWWD